MLIIFFQFIKLFIIVLKQKKLYSTHNYFMLIFLFNDLSAMFTKNVQLTMDKSIYYFENPELIVLLSFSMIHYSVYQIFHFIQIDQDRCI